MNKFSSNAEWPEEVNIGKIPNVSTDEHRDKETANWICLQLQRHGFGGEGKIFPIKTWVEEIPF